MDRIGETTGGKIATAIKLREQAGRATGTAQFDESSLSAGTKTGGMNSETESEIAEFVNRPASNDMGKTLNNNGAKSNASSTAASGKSVFD